MPDVIKEFEPIWRYLRAKEVWAIEQTFGWEPLPFLGYDPNDGEEYERRRVWPTSCASVAIAVNSQVRVVDN